jgi:N-acetylneuraminic acid mutarotase
MHGRGDGASAGRLRAVVSRLAPGGMAALACASIAALAMGGGGESASADTEQWTAATSSPGAPRTEVGAARIGDQIYVVGGASQPGAVASGEVRRYDISDDDWDVVAPMLEEVHHPAVTAYNGRLYVHGGYTANSSLTAATNKLQRYNPETNEWKERTPTTRPRAAHTLRAVNGKLYAIGGSRAGNQAPLASMSIYNIAKDSWKSGPSMPTAREHLASVVLDKRIFVAGGRRFNAGINLTAFERYSPPTGDWKRLPDLTVARSGNSAAVANGLIVVFGGEKQNPNATIPEVEAYDRSTKQWSELPDMLTPRHGLGGAGYRGRVFALEGGPNFGFTFSNANEYLDVE